MYSKYLLQPKGVLYLDRRQLASKIEQIYEVMRSDGLSLVDYVEQLSWLLFVKVLERLDADRKLEAEFEGKPFSPVIGQNYSWSTWAKGDLRVDVLKAFLENDLLSYLSSLSGPAEANLVATVFKDVKQKMRDPNNLKQIVLMIDEIDFSN